MIFAVVHKIVSPHIAEHVKTLAGLFEAVEESICNEPKPATPIKDFPVLELQESNRLRPKVRRLIIHTGGMNETAVQSWGAALQSALQTQPYLSEP
jgi:hypothetical protein